MEVETVETLLAVVAGGLVIPLIGGLKATALTNYVRPEFLKFIILALAAWGLMAWLYPDAPIVVQQIIDLALKATGAGTVLYGTKKALTKKS